MSMRGISSKETICETLRAINDMCQSNSNKDQKIRNLLVKSEKMSKKMIHKLREYNKQIDKEWWEKNLDYEVNLNKRLEKDYKIEKVYNKRPKVVFFDLGAYIGDSIERFLKISKALDFDYKIFSFEPNRRNYKTCIKKFHNNDNIVIYPIGIAGTEKHFKLYDPERLVGCSIYKDKYNIDNTKFEIIPCVRFSYIYKTIGNIYDADITILKMNIEGAELDVVRDLDKNNLFDNFDIFCNIAPSWTKDILKCESLKKYKSELDEILSNRSIKIIKEKMLHKVLSDKLNQLNYKYDF